MAMEVSKLERWLRTLESGSHVAIDDGGLTLVCLEDGDAYLEVGGVPDDDDGKTVCVDCAEERR